MKLLHIIATPRKHESHTLQIADAFLESMLTRYPDLNVEVLDLFSRDLPAMDGINIESKYSLMFGQPIDKHHQESWKSIEILIEHFLSADIYLMSVPMWNFSIPYPLKYYIDAIVQPGYLFKLTDGRAIGLVLNKKMVCITSRGSDYAAGTPYHAFDFQEPYLRAIFGFVGITDMHFINAQPMDWGPELRAASFTASIKEARELVANFDLSAIKAAAVNPPGLKATPI